MEKTPIDIDDLITEAQDAMFTADYAQCTTLCRQAVAHHRDEFSVHELLIQSLLAQHRDDEALAAAAEWCSVQPRSVVRQTAWSMARPRQWRLQAHAAYRVGAEETLSAVLDQQLVLLQDLTNVELNLAEEHVTATEHATPSEESYEQPGLDEHDLAAQSRDVQWQGTTAVLDAVTTAALWFDLQGNRARDQSTCEEDAELCTTIRGLIEQWCARRGELSATDRALVELLLAWCHVRAANTASVNHAPFTALMTRDVPNEIKIYALALSFVLEFDTHKPHITSDQQAEGLHKVTQHFKQLTQILHDTNDPKIRNDMDSSLLYRTITLLLKFLDPKERDQAKNELAHIRRRPGLSLILLGRVSTVLASLK
jgi:hypothetical protein